MQLKPEISTEAIDFQTKSPFAEAMIAYWQKLIDHTNQLRKQDLEQSTIIQRVFKEFKGDGTKPELSVDTLKSIITEHTGLTVGGVITFKQVTINAMVRVALINPVTQYKTRHAVQGTPSHMELMHVPKDMRVATAEEMTKLADGLNKKTGQFKKPSSVGLGKKETLDMELVLDLYWFLLLRETGTPKEYEPTAEEITAVLLHEIGHELTLIEHAGDGYYRFESWMAAEREFLQKAKMGERLNYLYAKASAVRNSGSDDDNTTVTLKMFRGGGGEDKKLSSGSSTKLTPNLPDKPASNDDAENSVSVSRSIGIGKKMQLRVNAFLTLMSMTLGLTLNFLWLMSTMPFRMIVAVGFWDDEGQLDWGSVKRSEIMTTDRNWTIIERLADEYMSRHGLSGADASMSIKIREIVLHFKVPSWEDTRNLEKRMRLVELGTSLLVHSDLFLREDPRRGYELSMDRIKRLQHNTVQLFKEADLPDEILMYHLREYDRIQKSLKELKGMMKVGPVAKAFIGFKKLIRDGGDIEKLGDFLMNGSFRKRYFNLTEIVDSLQASPLYQKAVRLEMLVRNK